MMPPYAPRAHAGPALDVWLERARAADGGSDEVSGLEPWSPTPGMRIGWGEPQTGAWPGRVANEFVGRGGVRLQTGALGGQGQLPQRGRVAG